MTSAPLAARLSEVAGPLLFPVTAYGPDGTVDLDVFRAPVRAGIDVYAVSLVKAGVRLQGLDVGEVRTPLTEPPAAHVKDLIASGRALLAGRASEGERGTGERA
ncbi:hypothetical protein AMK21_20100 [Streptomyces sp. CB00316]|nr:hypothetical protein AMK21_20100 [Streptomyces sp. CB00316]